MATVKYFGMLAEAVETKEESIEIAAISVAEFRMALLKKYSALSAMDFRIAVDQQFCEADTIITNKMEIALLPPFSGG